MSTVQGYERGPRRRHVPLGSRSLRPAIAALTVKVEALLALRDESLEQLQEALFRLTKRLNLLDGLEPDPPLETLGAVERRQIYRALGATHGHQRDAAKLLGIAPRVLGYRMRKHGISRARDGCTRAGQGR